MPYINSGGYSSNACISDRRESYSETIENDTNRSEKNFNVIDNEFIDSIFTSEETPELDFEVDNTLTDFEGQFDLLSVAGEAYEEMTRSINPYFDEDINNTIMDEDEFAGSLQTAFENATGVDPLDLNSDGYVSLNEYTSGVLMDNILSLNEESMVIDNTDAAITYFGQDYLTEYFNSDNYDTTIKQLQGIYDAYDIEEVAKEFASNENNINIFM